MIADKSILVNTRRNALVEGYNAAIEEAANMVVGLREPMTFAAISALIRALAKETTT